MKPFPAILAFTAASVLPAAAAPISIPSAGLVYSQNFDTLANATNPGNSVTPWADDATIPGWWLYRAGNGTPLGFVGGNYTYRVSDGSTSINGGDFFSLGGPGSTDRALGNPSSTNQGEMSAMVVFQNTGTFLQELTRIRHSVEVRRTNSNAGLLESMFVWSRPGASLAEIQTLSTAPATATVFPAGVASGPNSYYVTGWDRRAEAEVSYTGATAFTQVNAALPVNVVPSSRILVPPGQFFAIRYSNINDSGTDHQMGIDDVELTFTPVVIDLTASVSGVVRHDSGTPTDPGDDTVDFSLTVQGTGSLSPAGWTVTSPGTLAGQTGAYAVPKTFTGIPIADFSAGQHTLDVAVEDAGNPAGTAAAVVTAPWGSITPVISDVVRNDRGTVLASDDTWSYTVTVNGQFTGTGWTSDSTAIPSGNYGAPVTVTDLPIANPFDVITFADSADPSITTTFTAAAPRVIGVVNFGAPVPLFTDTSGVPQPWTVDEAAPTQTLTLGGGAPAKIYRSAVLDLTAVDQVKFSGSLLVNDTSSGAEPADSFNAQLIIDGNTAAPVSLIAPYDIIDPPDGVMTGAEITPAVAGSPPGTGAGNFIHRFFALVPDSANSVQLVISAANNSDSEVFTVQELTFQLASHSLEAIPGQTVFDNKGTVTAADDEFTSAVAITGINPPPSSTGWTSNSNPSSGLYTAPNPVLFGPFPAGGGAQSITLIDNGDPSVTATVNLPAPATGGLNAAFVGQFFTLNPGDSPGPEDDFATFQENVSDAIGGPEFRVFADYPVTATATSNVLSPAGNTVTVTLRNIPDHGLAYVYFEDASYPGIPDLLTLNFGNTVTDPVWILARRNLGDGPGNVYSAAGSILPVDWQNYAEVPALGMNGGTAAAPSTVTSEVIDLSSISGEVRFTANLHVVDISSGFEADDTLKVELIINGSAVNLITPHDTDGNGVMNGGDTAATDEFNAAKLQDGNYVSDFPLSYTIPDSAATVRLVVTGLNNSDNEAWVLENCLFALAGTPSADTDGDGISNQDEEIMGTDANDDTSFTRLAQTDGLPSEFTFSGVDGRFYRIYQSDDGDSASHLAKWTDTGLGASGAGSHTVNVTVQPGVIRRLYRVHVMQTDGPWPAVTP